MIMHRNFVIVLGGLVLLLIWSGVMLPTTSASATRPESEKGPSSTLHPLSDEPITVDGVTLVRLQSPDLLAPTAPTAVIMSEDFEGTWPASGWEVSDNSLNNASAAKGQFTPSQDNGDWGGTTSQNHPISFTVASNMVTFLHFRVSITTTFFTCTYPVYDYNTHNVSGNTFSVTGQENYLDGSTLTYTVTGTFNSNTSASGNLQATVSGFVCSGGSATPTPTWTATLQPPDPPRNLTAQALSSTQIRLQWEHDGTSETGFKIEQSLTGTSPWTQIATTQANVISHTVSGLNCETTYYYRVRAYNASGDSAYSNTANATTLACATVFLPVVMKD